MSTNTEPRLDQNSLLDDIERRVNEIFSAQKNEVEQSLVQRINREKEEAQKRIEAVNLEFTQVRSFLEKHKAAMAELQTVEEHLRGEIRGHFERAVNYQKMMEHAATLAGGELEKIGGLNEELEKLRVKAESIYGQLKSHLSGYAGIMAQIPAPTIRSEGDLDWTAEIDKLRKVRDLLATLHPVETTESAAGEAAAPAAVEAEPSAPAAEAAEELAASLGLVGPEDDGVHDDVTFAENDPAWSQVPDVQAGEPAAAVAAAENVAAEPATEPVPAEDTVILTDGFQFAAPPAESAAVLATLAGYRKSEPINNGIEVSFFASETGAFLDADSFMASIGKISEAASQLHAQLTQTTSVKDLFLLKQEILNQQEVLRKLFFRVVRFCEKENGHLPGSLDEIISSRSLKDIIERLTMANWSDPSDFKPFLNELKSMVRAFEVRTGSTPNYQRTVLAEVEGREN